jgi:microcystin-dependent protein
MTAYGSTAGLLSNMNASIAPNATITFIGATITVTAINGTTLYTPGNTGGQTAHQLTIAELASHDHRWGTNDNIGAQGGNGNPDAAGGTYWQASTEATGGDQFHENRPPYYALAFIMRVV